MPTLRYLLCLCLIGCSTSAWGQAARTDAEFDDFSGADPSQFGRPKSSSPPALPTPEAAQPTPRTSAPINTVPDADVDPFADPLPEFPPKLPAPTSTPPPTSSRPLPASERNRLPTSVDPLDTPTARPSETLPRAGTTSAPTRAPISLDRGYSVNPEVLRQIRDHTPGLEADDRDAYFRILSLARQLPTDLQEDHAREFLTERQLTSPLAGADLSANFSTYVDLYTSPAEYRGRPVTLRGHLRKVVKFDPGPNDNQIGEVYEGWLYPSDSENNPAVVIFQRKPSALPVAGSLLEEVQVTGYFFKLYGYPAPDGARSAPLILVGELQWTPVVASQTFKPLPFRFYLFFTTGLAIVIGVFWWQGVQTTADRRAAMEARMGGRDFLAYPTRESVSESFAETNDS